MLQFLSRRLLFILVVSILIVFAVQLGLDMASNSDSRHPDYDVVARGQAAWMETRLYLRQALSGELGTTQVDGSATPVLQLLAQSYVNSMGLLAWAMLLGVTLGLAFGALAALYKNGRLALPLLALTVLGISTPSFFAGLLLRSAELKYVSTVGRPLVSIAGFGWDYKHLLLPVLVLMARPLAYVTRSAFLGLNRVMQEDYIRTAQSKGLSQRRTVNVHAVRNFAIPVLTAIGVSLRFALGALPVVEFLFVWPGLGYRLLQAIDLRQATLAATLALALGLTFLLINLLLDLAYRWIDPRLQGV